MPPFFTIRHHNGSAFVVVLQTMSDTTLMRIRGQGGSRKYLGKPEFHDGVPAGYARFLVNFMLDGEAVSIPAEAPFYMEPLH